MTPVEDSVWPRTPGIVESSRPAPSRERGREGSARMLILKFWIYLQWQGWPCNERSGVARILRSSPATERFCLGQDSILAPGHDRLYIASHGESQNYPMRRRGSGFRGADFTRNRLNSRTYNVMFGALGVPPRGRAHYPTH